VRLRDGALIIIDAGSGIRPLGAALGPCAATLLLTHYHWDHIQGLPFFLSAFSPQSDFVVYGPQFDGKPPNVVLANQMELPYFPAPASELRGIKDFEVTPEEPFCIGSATVRAVRVSHPGTTFAYRIEEGDNVFVYMSDDEVDLAPPKMFDAMVDLCRGAEILLHDCQYTEAEYATRTGWGHSTPRQAVRLATAAKVDRLMIFHHDPAHTDEQVEAIAEEAQSLARDRCEVIIGCEGETLTLGSAVAESAS
jgi:ribonuclease BN (tRNA processing enzyme)